MKARAPVDAIVDTPTLPAAPTFDTSLFEEKYHIFDPKLIKAARVSKVDLTPQLERLNKISALCYGMAVVARIVAGNPVVAEYHDASDPNTAAPLTKCAIGHLNNMLAEICEHITLDICRAADDLDEAVAP